MLIKDMNAPLISVIIPVYNVEKYLRQCLESVIGQTYINLEIILIDDGSTDGSSKICDDFAAIDDRIVVIHQHNMGLSSARNVGLDIMKGDYVSFVDSDDWIERDMFAILLSSLEEEEADIAICSYYWVREDCCLPVDDSGNKVVYTREGALKELFRDKIIRNYVCDKFYKREIFESVRFPVGRFYEDIAITYKLFDKINKIVSIGVPKYYYRIHENSIVATENPIKGYHFFLGMYEQACFGIKNGLFDQGYAVIVKTGIHLINHIVVLDSSSSVDQVLKDTLSILHKFDNCGIKELGLGICIRRYLIYHFFMSYCRFYKLYRRVFKRRRRIR